LTSYNKSCVIVDITEFLIQKFLISDEVSLELIGGDGCDNLNFMNFKMDSFKIRKNREF